MKKDLVKILLKGNDRGFTLLEVLVSILVGAIFVAASLQLIVFSAVFRVKAQEYSEANSLISRNLETIRNIAANDIDKSDGDCNPSSESDGYAGALQDEINNQDLAQEFSVEGSESGKDYSIEREQFILNRQPYDVLQLSYTATEDGEEVATLYTEVIPDATFECPPQ